MITTAEIQIELDGGALLLIDHGRKAARLHKEDAARRVPYDEAVQVQAAGEQLLQVFAPEPSDWAPSEKEDASFVAVTPALARQMLGCNRGNRPVGRTQIARYTRLMREGRWRTTSDAVAFSKEGRLLNGQHRLQAILNSGTTQTMLVCTGLDPAVFHFLDYGAKRTGRDVLAVEGFSNPKELAALCRIVFDWQNGQVHLAGLQKKALHDDLLTLARAFPSLGKTIEACKTVALHALNELIPWPYTFFVHWAYTSGGYGGAIDAFLEALTQDITDPQTPASQLRRRLIENRDSESSLKRTKLLALVIQAANLHVLGKRQRLRMPTRFPDPCVAFPRPDVTKAS